MTLASEDEPDDRSPLPASRGNRGRWRHALRRFILWVSSNGPADPPEVRERLLRTITDRKGALVVSAVAVGFVAITAGVLTGALWPYLWLLAELLLDGARIALINRHHKNPLKRTDESFTRLFYGGYLWSVVLGLGLAACAASGKPVLAVMAGVVVAGSMGVVISRNAAVPRYTRIVLWTVALLFVAGCLLSPNRQMILVAFQVPMATVGLQFMLGRNYQLVIRMIRAEIESRTLAMTDRLTTLPNRLSFEDRLERTMTDFAEGGQFEEFALLYLDLDGFKAVNDRYGHLIGDLLLKAVSHRLVHVLQDRNNVYRLGGDEFAAILPGTTSDEAAMVAGQILASISQPFDMGLAEPIRIGTSIGSVQAPMDGMMGEQLMREVDRALYAAKDAGRGIHRAGGQSEAA